jgi:import receptor subunit TOM20
LRNAIDANILSDAAYFDYKRRNDPDFRKNLKKEKKRHHKAQKARAAAASASQREKLREAVRKAQAEGFPADVEEKEAYFMSEVARGEALCSDGTSFIDKDFRR